jgi:hypothetical protein
LGTLRRDGEDTAFHYDNVEGGEREISLGSYEHTGAAQHGAFRHQVLQVVAMESPGGRTGLQGVRYNTVWQK